MVARALRFMLFNDAIVERIGEKEVSERDMVRMRLCAGVDWTIWPELKSGVAGGEEASSDGLCGGRWMWMSHALGGSSDIVGRVRMVVAVVRWVLLVEMMSRLGSSGEGTRCRTV